jgi:uncharacterized membrane protein HdeD (DUF308 family)
MISEKKLPWYNRLRKNITLWLSLYRGGVAVVLGMVLIFYPTRTQALLVNLMGFFWLSTGFTLFRQKIVGKRTSTVIGLVVAVSGLLVISRNLIRQWFNEVTIISVLGVVVVVTGVLHMMSGVRFAALIKNRKVRAAFHFLLGAFECFFGLLLISSPLERGPLIYWVATIWSLLFGTLVIGSALYEHFWNKPEAESQ